MPATASTSTAVPGMPPFRPAKKMRKFCGWRLVVICPRRRVRALHRGNSHRGWLGRVRDVTFVVCASRFGVLAFAVVSAIRFCFCFCFCFLPFAFAFAGIRELLAYFTRRPCAGRHLLFFAAAKKSRQKKAAHTASPCSCPRAPNVPTLHAAAILFACVASALSRRLTRFNYPYPVKRQRMVCAAQVANCV